MLKVDAAREYLEKFISVRGDSGGVMDFILGFLDEVEKKKLRDIYEYEDLYYRKYSDMDDERVLVLKQYLYYLKLKYEVEILRKRGGNIKIHNTFYDLVKSEREHGRKRIIT